MVSAPAWSIGAVLAVIVLVLCIVLAVADVSGAPSHLALALIGALAVARLT